MEQNYIQEENQIFEKKASLSNEKKFLKTVCAFANTEGGTIVIGVKGKEIIGVEKKDEIQQRIYKIIKAHLNPLPQIEIKIEKVGEKEVIVVYVFPIGEGNICTYDGKTYVRMGSVNHLIEGSQLSQFILQRGIISFEDQISSAKLEDIDKEKVEKYLNMRGSSHNLSLKNTLINLKVATNTFGIKIKNLGLMLFAKKIEKFIPQSGVKIVVFDGEEPINIKKHKVMFDTVFELIEKTTEFIKENTLKSIKIKGLKRIEEGLYPEEVIRELIVNAIGHRNYFDGNLVQVSIFSDRIEISNPAILPPNFSVEDLGSIAIHRNPNLYLHLSFAKYCEGYGTGIARIRKILKNKGYLPPKFEIIGNWFKVTIYNKEFHKIEERILEIIKEKGKVSTLELSKILNKSKVSIVKHLNQLIEKKAIIREGKGKNIVYKLRE